MSDWIFGRRKRRIADLEQRVRLLSTMVGTLNAQVAHLLVQEDEARLRAARGDRPRVGQP